MDLIEQFEALRERAYNRLTQDRSELGQFYTPQSIAIPLGGMFCLPLPKVIRILDPGAGVGILSAVAVVRLIELGAHEIHLTCCEFSEEIIPLLMHGVSLIAKYCNSKGVIFGSNVVQADFVKWASQQCQSESLFKTEIATFDAIIQNPPYKKITASSEHRKLLRSAGLECTNLYAAFLYLSARLLSPRGQLVSINPRSFANGPYFRDFRKQLFQLAPLHEVRMFSRRDQAFSADQVLQEHVILRAVRGPVPAALIVQSSIAGETVFHSIKIPMDRVLRPNDPEMILHLETNEQDSEVASTISSLPCSLAELGLTVSTGRVVDFRARNALSRTDSAKCFPLIYPTHLSSGSIRWPKLGKKHDYFCPNNEQKTQLVPAGYYVLTKRFTSKEEKRRIVAAVISPQVVPGECYALENHVNYFHNKAVPLSKHLASGLAAFLNSKVADTYFRIYNGHTQVNATDLRAFRYPAIPDLEMLGASLSKAPSDQASLDSAVEALCNKYSHRTHAARPKHAVA